MPRDLKRGKWGRHWQRVLMGPSREQAAREKAQVVAEVEQRASPTSPLSPEQECSDDEELGTDRALMDTLLGGGPQVTPQTSNEMISGLNELADE
ncbi:hypothetical protein NDU88_008945 [Pleurodeles waltl]|uniref:Uncharacterized protein n=1 Tax=Pleurodeles waltl TaxID=8319 RepID=A0AAV7PUM0_PLEWA|nr:hypothetical protein NDU88_008945 [Pleurodeles waltl]